MVQTTNVLRPGSNETEARLPKGAIIDIDAGWIQKLHAGLILVVPTLCIAIAGYQLYFHDVELWPIVLMFAFWFLTILGITVGFHRFLSHRAFKTNEFVKAIILILGSMAAQGPPIYWASNHRRHHRFSDQNGDPHSPHVNQSQKLSGFKGFLHAHIQWSFNHKMTSAIYFSKDLLRDKTVHFVNKHYYIWVLLSIFLPAVIGLLITNTLEGFLNGLLWGTGVRLFFTYHATNGINSLTHLFGYRNYQVDDKSRNNWFLALPTLGEGWHNNHHAYPSSAYFDHKWWEIDIGGWFIRLLVALKLASSPKIPKTKFVSKQNHVESMIQSSGEEK